MIVQINIEELKKKVPIKFELYKMISLGLFDIRCKAIKKKTVMDCIRTPQFF